MTQNAASVCVPLSCLPQGGFHHGVHAGECRSELESTPLCFPYAAMTGHCGSTCGIPLREGSPASVGWCYTPAVEEVPRHATNTGGWSGEGQLIGWRRHGLNRAMGWPTEPSWDPPLNSPPALQGGAATFARLLSCCLAGRAAAAAPEWRMEGAGGRSGSAGGLNRVLQQGRLPVPLCLDALGGWVLLLRTYQTVTGALTRQKWSAL